MAKIGLIILGLAICAGLALIFLRTETDLQTDCGNNVCDKSENCLSCSPDCKCTDNEICKRGRCERVIACGDDICDEDCWTCPKDCPCNQGEYCDEKIKKCTISDCGDGVCEFYEDQNNCCLDCPCYMKGTVCNKVTNACEYPKSNCTINRTTFLL